jgi:DNA-directed RNA polymerase alpha subunit
MKEQTAWGRLRAQFKPDSKGRFKTLDAMKIAVEIDNERLALIKELDELKKSKLNN